MKIRLILLSIAGLVAYVALANFNSKIIRETETPKDHGQVAAPQVQAGKQRATPPLAEQHKASVPAPSQLTVQQPVDQPQAQTPADGKLQQLQEELARKDRQIKQLLEAQEAIAAREHALQTEATGTVESPDRQLEEKAKQIEELTAEKGQATAELNRLKTQLEQLRQELKQQQERAAEASGKMLKDRDDRLAAMTADQEKSTAELKRAKAELEQLQQKVVAIQTAGSQIDQAAKEKEAALAEAQQQLQNQIGAANQLKAQIEQLRQELNQQQMQAAAATGKILKDREDRLAAMAAVQEKSAAELKRAKAELEQLQQKIATMQTAGAQNEQAAKEKEAALAEARQQLQNQAGAADQFKAQLAETVDRLTATKRDLEQAESRAEALLRSGAEKEQQANALAEQKKAAEQALAEKKEALDNAILTIQSLKQEIAGQPQAVATVQRLLDERNREFDRVHQEAAGKIEQLDQQIAALGKDKAQAAKELERCAAEIENSRKGAGELEALRTKMQTMQTEAEHNLAAAMEGKEALQSQLKEKVAALGGVQAKIDELTATVTSLRNEKLGLTSQLEALQADNTNLLGMKNAFEGQAAALAQAEGKLKEMAALQAKNDEMGKAMAEKDAALEQAAKQTETLTALQARLGETAKQTETSDATIKQLEQEKTDMAGQLAAAQALAQNIDGLKKTLDEKSNALALAETKTKELDGIKQQIAEIEAKATAAQTAQVAAEKKVAESEAAAKRCNESLTAAGDKVKQLETGLAEAQNRVKELTDKNQLQAQQDLVPTLNQQIATLRSQLDEATTAAEARNEETKAANKKAQILQTERDGLQQELTANQTAISELQKQLEAAKGQPRPAAATQTQAQPADKPAAEADSDRDGVADSADLCPGSPAGVPVNALGCPQDKTAIVLEGIVFSSGTASLTPDSLKKLDRIAAALTQSPQTKLEVAGYTDNVGDAKRNQRLSTQRAQTVSAYLSGKGIAASRLQAKGYGAENPVGDNATAEGRQQNRRIELHVLAP
ncbi:OmpA family protein [Desulfobulbus sp.]|uniref:OmpA family protein n=1 Tax=Desulfobulbus sp. TaxID=895 RepID=UPI00286F93E4|nr:OmpA family protein [Desulfobulbus sp.]